MAIPDALIPGLRVPVISAPMLLVSNPRLVLETCRAGAIGSFPAFNTRSTTEYEDWLYAIEQQRALHDATFAVNLIVGKSNTRLADDLAVTVRHRVPLVITSLGADQHVVNAVHDYGGLVFHDVASARHVEIAAKAGVDGLILLTGGAGGHTGFLNPFAFLQEARRRFDGALILSGALSTGSDVAAAVIAGADLAYMGTRFIATDEAFADAEYKAMIVAAGSNDVVVTSAMSGNPASFLSASLRRAGFDPKELGLRDPRLTERPDGQPLRPWKEVWSAGQGVAGIQQVLPAGVLVRQLGEDYTKALVRASGLTMFQAVSHGMSARPGKKI
ncbi:NAD(P)H-dependent flavin oxidoreductase [Tardiphaga sp. 538_B7_N1_4]|uniref:NAD(P)H-dependent flavin oxidoreductase n=1 Tax=Tardiphaga sp. 538_B7_N1_4 TaxID=3240778 RepID=UPI001B8A1493|nr:nitronate monooxygenase [Bradyrhizobium diazoefficiens]MBR0967348.1 nitronate monooxygenase [Bradyrhizobium diazoefficiens]MBR0976669.1 nitronate monooxygenase [Bradyrhizobium diazoefficiens]MBR1005314.1 nitronate monooxygenase [Bradyrhizobium diazoefficiens]MBR1011787.1 nitronate monooxygenase [Bradyrhizobium diazoefficiens]MBR1049128.1 nitronate monooxygenase [Bradyrhizobium diazoefficiens]